MRYLVRFILVLCLATALQVAVAWASEIWGSGPYSGDYDITPKQRVAWIGPVPGTWPAQPRLQYRYGSPFVTEFESRAPSRDVSFVDAEYSERACLSGLPFHSMFSRVRWEPVGPHLVTSSLSGLEYRTSPQLAAVWPRTNTGLLSLNPIWPGFIGNTLVYSMLVVLLLPSTRRVVRRHTRLSRGHCPECDYPIASLARPDIVMTRCPECGHQSRLRLAEDRA